MIDYIRGILAEKEVGYVALEAHGVGYEIIIPLSTFERLPAQGSDVRLYTHHHIREDIQKLYGFVTKSERELFRQLIGISSIGPKTAISILSKMSVDELVRFVTLGDSTRLTKIPGIGAKTAQRLVIELRGKLKVTGTGSAVQEGGAEPGGRAVRSGAREEAFEALISLGYNEKQVAKAIERVQQSLGDKSDISVEEWIKKALQVI
jgi:Holliday junction DNA helicase RuvA